MFGWSRSRASLEGLTPVRQDGWERGYTYLVRDTPTVSPISEPCDWLRGWLHTNQRSRSQCLGSRSLVCDDSEIVTAWQTAFSSQMQYVEPMLGHRQRQRPIIQVTFSQYWHHFFCFLVLDPRCDVKYLLDYCSSGSKFVSQEKYTFSK